jgi:hypothetical protein
VSGILEPSRGPVCFQANPTPGRGSTSVTE